MVAIILNRTRALVATLVWLATCVPAHAIDYASVADETAILYDAPSVKSQKLFVISRYSPLEEIVNLSDWVKVRDSSGALAWIEKRALSNKRYIVVTAARTDAHPTPDEGSPVIAQVRQQVALERLEDNGAGWLKVNLPDGTAGYIKSADTWGN